MKEEFFRLAIESDRNKAGLALELLLNRLFESYQLHPRQPFRIVGEQIDGSFELEGQIYLLEAKWEKQPLPEADLLIFRGKIEGKSTFTRGVFIALNDVSLPARDAITRGKAPSFFVMNGHDLTMILSEALSLTEFLRKARSSSCRRGMCVRSFFRTEMRHLLNRTEGMPDQRALAPPTRFIATSARRCLATKRQTPCVLRSGGSD